jgi:hypothetical protein
MRVLAIVLTLVLTACGNGALYQTKHGILVYNDTSAPTPSKAEIELITDQAIAALIYAYPDIFTASNIGKALREWRGSIGINFRENINGRGFECATKDSPGRMCYGQYDHAGHIEIAYKECLALTSLAHELWHFLDHAVRGVSDLTHDELIDRYMIACDPLDKGTPWQECLRATLEWQVKETGCDNICSADQCQELGCGYGFPCQDVTYM